MRNNIATVYTKHSRGYSTWSTGLGKYQMKVRTRGAVYTIDVTPSVGWMVMHGYSPTDSRHTWGHKPTLEQAEEYAVRYLARNFKRCELVDNTTYRKRS